MSPLVPDSTRPTLGIEVLAGQMVQAARARLYFVALVSAIALIDACGGADSPRGWSNSRTFVEWSARYLSLGPDDAEHLYNFRNALLHQSRNVPNAKGDRIGFLHAPRGGGVHNLSLQVDDAKIGMMTIEIFIEEVDVGVRRWLAQRGGSPDVRSNLEGMVELRPDGVPPFFAGCPAIF